MRSTWWRRRIASSSGWAKSSFTTTSRALSDVVEELNAHADADYLRSEFAVITNKIDLEWPHAERLKKLLDPSTLLDEVFDAICIPVLLTYASKAVAAHTKVTADFKKAFAEEAAASARRICPRTSGSTFCCSR